MARVKTHCYIRFSVKPENCFDGVFLCAAYDQPGDDMRHAHGLRSGTLRRSKFLHPFLDLFQLGGRHGILLEIL